MVRFSSLSGQVCLILCLLIGLSSYASAKVALTADLGVSKEFYDQQIVQSGMPENLAAKVLEGIKKKDVVVLNHAMKFEQANRDYRQFKLQLSVYPNLANDLDKAFEAGDVDSALAVIGKAALNEKNEEKLSELHYLEGLLLSILQRPAAAMQVYRQALAIADEPQYQLGIAKAKFALGQSQSSRSEVQRAEKSMANSAS